MKYHQSLEIGHDYGLLLSRINLHCYPKGQTLPLPLVSFLMPEQGFMSVHGKLVLKPLDSMVKKSRSSLPHWHPHWNVALLSFIHRNIEIPLCKGVSLLAIQHKINRIYFSLWRRLIWFFIYIYKTYAYLFLTEDCQDSYLLAWWQCSEIQSVMNSVNKNFEFFQIRKYSINFIRSYLCST